MAEVAERRWEGGRLVEVWFQGTEEQAAEHQTPETGRWAEAAQSVSRGSKAPVHGPLSHWISLTKHNYKDKIMKNFKKAMAEH